MRRTIRIRAAVAVLAVPAMLAAAATPLVAQAWVPAQGEGAVSVIFQDQFFKYHALPTVQRDIGEITVRSTLVDLSYGLTDKAAISVGLPWVATKYQGALPHPLADFSGPNPIDNGQWHSTAQDFRF